MARSVHRRWNREFWKIDPVRRQRAEERLRKEQEQERARLELREQLRQQLNRCRKCGGDRTLVLEFEEVGVKFLPKGSCCGKCSYEGMVTVLRVEKQQDEYWDRFLG